MNPQLRKRLAAIAISYRNRGLNPPSAREVKRLFNRTDPNWILKAEFLRKKGFSYPEVAAHFGVSNQAVHERLVRSGIGRIQLPRKGRGFISIRDYKRRKFSHEEAAKLYQKGVPKRQIARVFDVSNSTVISALKKLEETKRWPSAKYPSKRQAEKEAISFSERKALLRRIKRSNQRGK